VRKTELKACYRTPLF